MGFGVKTVSGEDLSQTGGTKMSVPGWYHVNVLNAKDGLDSNDKPIEGCSIEFEVLAGKPDDSNVTKDDIVGKTTNQVFFAPDGSDTDAQAARKNKLNTALLIATDLITPSQLGQDVDVSIADSIGRHAIIHLKYKTKKETNQAGEEVWVDDKRYLQIAFADVLHIDDPDGSAVPRNAAALKFVDPKFRHKPDYFAFKAKKSRGHVQPATSTPPKDVAL